MPTRHSNNNKYFSKEAIGNNGNNNNNGNNKTRRTLGIGLKKGINMRGKKLMTLGEKVAAMGKAAHEFQQTGNALARTRG